MADLSALSNDDLLKMYQPQQPAPASNLASMSDEQLKALYQAPSPTQQQIDQAMVAPPTLPTMGEVSGALGSFAHGQSLGVGDELDAAAKATLAPITRPIARALGGGSPETGDTWQQRYDKILAGNREKLKTFAKENPVTNAIGNAAGAVLSTTAMLPEAATSAPSFAGRLLKGTGVGAGLGGLLGFTEGEGGVDERLAAAQAGAKSGAIVGAVVPTALSAVGRVVTPFPTDATRAAAVKTLTDAGVPVSAGNRVGNDTLRAAEDYIAKLPLGTALSKNPSAESMKAVTQAVAAKAGLPAGEVPTADVLKRGFDKIGGTIGNIQKNYAVAIDDALIGDAVNIADGLPTLLPGRQASAGHFLNRITSGQEITPEIAQTTRTQLGRAIRAQNGPQGDKEYQGVLFEIKDALDEALARTIQKGGNPAHLAQLQQARQQYANLHTLSDALYSSGPKGQLGQLTPGALQSGMARALGKASYMKGQGELTPLASASKAILPQVPESGTPLREGILNPVKWALSVPGQLAVNSRPAQAYWGNQLLPQGAAQAATLPILAGVEAERARRKRGLLNP